MKNNNYICHPSYLKNIAYGHDFWYTSVKQWKVFFFFFFQFFKILNFCFLVGLKGQKMVQN